MPLLQRIRKRTSTSIYFKIKYIFHRKDFTHPMVITMQIAVTIIQALQPGHSLKIS